MNKLYSASFSGQLIHFFLLHFQKKGTAGKRYDAPVERDRPRSRTVELHQLDTMDEQAHAMYQLDKVNEQAHDLDYKADVDQQIHALDQLNEVNIYKFIFTSNNCLKNKQNQLVCTFSVDETDE